jgi:hypothetical protein
MHLECAFASWSSRGHASEVHKYCKTPPPCALAAGGLSQSRPRWYGHKASCFFSKTCPKTDSKQRPSDLNAARGCSLVPLLPNLSFALLSYQTLQPLPDFFLLGLNSDLDHTCVSSQSHYLEFPRVWLLLVVEQQPPQVQHPMVFSMKILMLLTVLT